MRGAPAILVLLLAGPAGAAERVSSEDGKFSLEVGAPWSAERGIRGRSVELKDRDVSRLLVAGEWRDGAAPVPSEAQQARLQGAETASLPRQGKVPLRHARRPAKRGSRFQGWLSCGGDRFLFDAIVEREEQLWTTLETFACKAAAPSAGLDVGDTGWKITIPEGFKRLGLSVDGRGMWERDTRRQARGAGGVEWVDDKDHLRVMNGTETWSLSRPWPGTCTFGDAKSLTLEAPKLQEHRGKSGFLYACGYAGDNEQLSLAFDLIIDYDAELGEASFISLRLSHWGRDPKQVPLDRGLFARIVQSLERSRPAAAGPTAAPAAVPLLR